MRASAHGIGFVIAIALSGGACGGTSSPPATPQEEPPATEEPSPGSSQSPPQPTRPATAEPAKPPLGLVFDACPGGYSARECATLRLPLDWSEPQGETIPVLVARSPALASRRDGQPVPQLWMLQGGPGGSGADFTEFFAQLHALFPEVDLYTLDHRGVGKSARLNCPVGEDAASPGGATVTDAEWPGCVAELTARWGARLQHFSVTAAAKDLEAAIARTRRATQQVFVYGVSYGSYWAHRYLQVAAEPPAGVILDSIAPPEGQDMSQFEAQFDPVAKRVASLCAAHAGCSARLGPDPWARMDTALRAHRAGACPNAGPYPHLRRALANMLMTTELSAYVPATLFRLERCSPDDQTALAHLSVMGDEGRAGAGPASEPLFSEALYFNVVFSELWPSPAPSKADLQADVDRFLIGTGGALSLRIVFDLWPRQTPDAYVHKWAATSVPLLMMNGDLDVQTPIESAALVETRFNRENQTFVRMTNANHGVMFQSKVPGQRVPCGLELAMAFVKDPLKKLDTACVAKVAPPNFDDPRYAQWLFGTSDVWGLSRPNLRRVQPTVPPPRTPFAGGRRFETIGR